MRLDGRDHGLTFDPIPDKYKDGTNSTLHDSRWLNDRSGLAGGRQEWVERVQVFSLVGAFFTTHKFMFFQILLLVVILSQSACVTNPIIHLSLRNSSETDLKELKISLSKSTYNFRSLPESATKTFSFFEIPQGSTNMVIAWQVGYGGSNQSAVIPLPKIDGKNRTPPEVYVTYKKSCWIITIEPPLNSGSTIK